MSVEAINLQKNPDFRNFDYSKKNIWIKYKDALNKAGNDVLERIGYNSSLEKNVS